MKRLYLLRHAKSSWDDPALEDRDRPLNARGRRAAPAVGRELYRIGVRPDFTLCSTAVRTLETLTLLRPYLPEEMPCLIEPALYEAAPETILDIVRDAPEAADRLLVIGHNPGLEELLEDLLENPEDRPDKFPTAGLAVLETRARQWPELAPGTVRLTAFVKPKDLPETQ